ncbi:hypothetical protein CN463_26405 [Bacillus cereus]|uniref:hypothetical protein n=1 Tax=Bacillus cereus TaxID=1396 RepID=UPI000BEE4FAE|nr:hypothetical protein [Bacillus cereus]PED89417.1 hypothetical protein CON43_08805 [Bacillus cereus]PER67902.1 hypothetical protein CN503_10375 [Bacillus cereus]PEX57699.1 hypothetical protein CN463_26405 [Bacillus cereus]PFC23460.1 hypothetical protein CN264_19200 [Bacillus cereus]PFU87814.1 hypothetical protein COL04_19440 [Bacillus cereus]
MYKNYYSPYFQYQNPYSTFNNHYVNPHLSPYTFQPNDSPYFHSVGRNDNIQVQSLNSYRAPYRCCDYYSDELDEVKTQCEDIDVSPDACPDTIVENGYTYRLIVQRNYDDCLDCYNHHNLKQRLRRLPEFSGKSWVPVSFKAI